MAFHTLAEHCSFGDTLDEMLCDRFVCGTTDPVVQKCLLSKRDFTFTKVVTIAQAAELADKRSKETWMSPGNLPKIFTSFPM